VRDLRGANFVNNFRDKDQMKAKWLNREVFITEQENEFVGYLMAVYKRTVGGGFGVGLVDPFR
jgi:hypothetical protein